MDPLAQQFARYRDDGDLHALGAVFDALAPRLLSVALHLTGRDAEAEDLVQQTFLVAIERATSFDATRRLEPWLAGVLVNMARNARRGAQRRPAVGCADRASDTPDPVSAAERQELVAQVRVQIDALPHEQRQVLLLQLQHGLAPAAIAEVLAVPAGTVRMRLHRGLLALRRVLPAGLMVFHGIALASPGLAAVRAEVMRGAACRTVAAPASATTAPVTAGLIGGSVMSSKLLFLFAAALACGLLWWMFLQGPDALAPTRGTMSPPDPVIASPARQDASQQAPERVVREVASSAPVHGALRVRVLAQSGADRHPLAGMVVELWPGDNELPPFSDERLVRCSDARGEVWLPALGAGAWRVQLASLRDEPACTAHVVAANETELEVVRDAAFVAVGVVVDADGIPVAGADLWVHRGTWLGRYRLAEPEELESRCVGTSGDDGRFVVPVVARERVIGANHPAHGESRGRYFGKGRGDLRIVLGRASASLEVSVHDARGEPIAEALVRLDPPGKETRRAADGALLAPRVPRLARTDAAGVCVFQGLAPGEQRVWAIAWPHVQAVQTVTVAAHAHSALALVLTEGVGVVGTVRSRDGAPVRVQLCSRPHPDFNGHWSQCDAREDGSFVLRYQPQRSFWIVAIAGGAIVAQREVVAAAPGWLRCDLVIEVPLPAPAPTNRLHTASLRGRLLAADAMPVGDLRLRIERADGRGEHHLQTAADGTFAFEGVGPGRWLLTHDRGGGWVELRAVDIAPAQLLDVGDVVMAATATLDVLPTHADGSPWRTDMPGIDLRSDAAEEVIVAHEFFDGGMRITAPPGSYDVALRATDLITPPLRVTLTAGETTTVRLPLSIGRTARLTFNGNGDLKPDVDAVLDVTVRAADGTVAVRARARTMPDLRGFRYWPLLVTLPFGRYEVEATGAAGLGYRGVLVTCDDLEAVTDIDVPKAP